MTDQCPDSGHGTHEVGDNNRCQWCDQTMEDPR